MTVSDGPSTTVKALPEVRRPGRQRRPFDGLRRGRSFRSTAARLGVLSVGGLIAILPACKKEPSGPTMLDATRERYATDIPVPDGFRLDRQASDHSYQEGRRKIRHIYRGSDDPQAVRNFYYQSMPTDQWRLVDETLRSSVYTLRYKKYEEACEVRIEKVPAGLFKPGTQVVVTVRTPHLDSSP